MRPTWRTTTPVDHRRLTLEPHRIGTPSTGQRQRMHGPIEPLYPDRKPGRWMHRLLALAAIVMVTLNLLAIAQVLP